MSYYEFIFSDNRPYRFRRHTCFWIAWCLYFAISFLVPTYWVPAWNFNAELPQINKYGVAISIFRILMNSVLMTVVHMLLVYAILYYFLPKYLDRNSNKIYTSILLFLFICLVACFNYLNFLMTFYISTRMGFFPKMPDMNYIVPIWIRQIIFNYPTVIGLAVSIRLLKRWYLKQKETNRLIREKINAELQLLKAQVHPHFLFNTLNNIYSFILNGSDEAPAMIRKLSGLLSYIIYDCKHPYVDLDKELSMIRSYVDLEKVRYGDRLNLSIHVHGDSGKKMISPLLLIPFVENSFKHGSSKMLAHPWVRLEIYINQDHLEFSLSNNKPGLQNQPQITGGIGLKNVKKRLELLYPDSHSLDIRENEMSYDVVMKVALCDLESEKDNTMNSTRLVYELT